MKDDPFFITNIRDIHDVNVMVRLDADARQKLEVPQCIADAFIGELLISGASVSAISNALGLLAIQAGQAIASDRDAMHAIVRRTSDSLSVDLPAGKSCRKPFHWPLNFPEVFNREHVGFDALIGNPPFIGGTRISGRLGKASLRFLQQAFLNGVSSDGRGDLCAYFFLQAKRLVRADGCFGLIATNTIGEGDTLRKHEE